MTMTITSGLHVFWCFYLVVYLNLGVKGVGIATMISYSQNLIMITVFCKVIQEFKASFFFPTRESLSSGMSEYLAIALPNVAMLVLEWGGLEILTLVATMISVDATSA